MYFWHGYIVYLQILEQARRCWNFHPRSFGSPNWIGFYFHSNNTVTLSVSFLNYVEHENRKCIFVNRYGNNFGRVSILSQLIFMHFCSIFHPGPLLFLTMFFLKFFVIKVHSCRVLSYINLLIICWCYYLPFRFSFVFCFICTLILMTYNFLLVAVPIIIDKTVCWLDYMLQWVPWILLFVQYSQTKLLMQAIHILTLLPSIPASDYSQLERICAKIHFWIVHRVVEMERKEVTV